MTGEPDDDTVRLKVPRQESARPKSARAPRSPMLPWIAGATLGAGVAAGGAWFFLRETTPLPGPVTAAQEPATLQPATATPPPAQPAPPAPPTQTATSAPLAPPVSDPLTARPAAPALVVPSAAETPPSTPAQPEQLSSVPRTQLAFAPPAREPDPAPDAPPLATEAQILADQPATLAIYRFAPRPAVIVLQFPSLEQQADMLNRVAALIEKSGFPRDRVLSQQDLDARIIASGASPADFYYGHDYRSADLLRFFQLATDLDPQEQELQRLVRKLGWEQPGAVGALVTLVRQSSAPALDAHARAAILRHELSHGVYFTDPEYAAYSARFFDDKLTPSEREKFVAFLGREGYDTTIKDLMINETQAYLMHTPDRRFFNPQEVGIPEKRVAELRQIFLLGMAPGWLRDVTAADKLP